MGDSQILPLYPGEDSRPTSRKELAGWYSYGWAAEVFAICAMGMAKTRCTYLVSCDAQHLSYQLVLNS